MSRRSKGAALTAAAAITAVLVAGFCLWLIGRARLESASERFVETVGSLEMSAYQRPDVPAERNAAHWLEAGAEALVLQDGEMDGVQRLLAPPIGQTAPEDRMAVQELIDRNHATLDLLGRSAGLTESTFGVDYTQGLAAAIPPFLELYNASRIVRAEGRLALLAGDSMRLGRDVEILDQMAAAMTRESILISVLFGLAVDRAFLLTVHDVIESGVSDVDLIADLAQRLEARDRTEALRRSFSAEGALVVTTPMEQLIGEDESLRSRAGLALFEPLQQADLLDGWADLATALDRPWVAIERDFAAPSGAEPRAPWDVHFFMLPNILSAIERLKANLSSTLLARQAVELWALRESGDDYPAAISFPTNDPYAGEPFRYEVHEDGSVSLTAPGAEALWREANPANRPENHPIFTWTLEAAGRRPGRTSDPE